MRKFTLILLVLSFTIFSISCASAKEKMTPKGKVNLRNAKMYLQQSKLDKALSFYQEVLKENPDNLESTKFVGDIYMQWGEDKVAQPIDTTKSEADQNLQKIKHDNESVEAYITAFKQYQKVQELMKDESGLTKEELPWKKETEKKMLGCEARIFNTGKIYVMYNDYATAEPIFQKLYQLVPQKPEAMKMLLFIDLAQQDAAPEAEKASFNPKIEDLLNKLLVLNPNDLDTLSKLGAFYYTNKDMDKALNIFKQIEVQKPKDIDNLFSLVGIYYEKKMVQEAYETDLKILAIEPKNLDAVDNARNFAVELKKTDEAKKYFIQLLEISKTTENVSQYCFFLFNHAMYADLLPVAKEWYDMDDTSKDAVNFIVQAATKLGKKDMASYYSAILKKM